MVDRAVLASKVAAVQDAVARITEVLPKDLEGFLADRTAREVVLLNLFMAVQECISLAAHWLADAGAQVPQTYREIFLALGKSGDLPHELAARLAAASGLRNLMAHQYGTIDWRRIFDIAASHTGDLLEFCAVLTRRAGAD